MLDCCEESPMNFFGAGLRPRIYGGFGILIVIALELTLFATWKLSAVRDGIERFDSVKDFFHTRT
jgi:hypothetical protein